MTPADVVRVEPVIRRALGVVLRGEERADSDLRAELLAEGMAAAVVAWPRWDDGRGERADLIFVAARNAMTDALRRHRLPLSATRWHGDLAEVRATEWDDEGHGDESTPETAAVAAADLEHARAWRDAFRARAREIAAERPAYALGTAWVAAREAGQSAEEVAERYHVTRAAVYQAGQTTRRRWARDREMAALLDDAPSPGVLAALEDAEQLAAAAAPPTAQEIDRADPPTPGVRRADPRLARGARRPPRPAPRGRARCQRGAGRHAGGNRARSGSGTHCPRPRRGTPPPPVIRCGPLRRPAIAGIPSPRSRRASARVVMSRAGPAPPGVTGVLLAA